MATYAIGDIQGCFQSLRALLARVGFDEERDRLWLVGDLVNRGPESLEVLRWVRNLGDRATVVLGNHDLNLLSVSLGIRQLRKKDTFAEVLHAPDGEELIGWLRTRPLVHSEAGYVMVHAGLHPSWTAGHAVSLGKEVERFLQSPKCGALLEGYYAPHTDRWDEDLAGLKRAQAALRTLTTLRTLDGSGKLSDYTGPLGRIPEDCTPWFDVPRRMSTDAFVLFGHWAALGYHPSDSFVGLDSGCVWGGSLTALRLEDRVSFSQPSLKGDARG